MVFRHKLLVWPPRGGTCLRPEYGLRLVQASIAADEPSKRYATAWLIVASKICSHLLIIDLELYTIWTDGFQLLALALLLLAMADAVPLPDWLPNITPNDASASKAKKQYARAAVLITIFHHVTTGIGAYQHWAKPSHHTVAMDIGVYGNVFFTVLGALALLFGLSGEPRAAVAKKHV